MTFWGTQSSSADKSVVPAVTIEAISFLLGMKLVELFEKNLNKRYSLKKNLIFKIQDWDEQVYKLLITIKAISFSLGKETGREIIFFCGLK